MLIRFTRFCFHRRWFVLAAWVLVLIGTQVTTSIIGPNYSEEFHLSGYDSQRAQDLLTERFPEWSGLSGDIVFRTDGSVTDAETTARMTAMFDEFRALPQVISIHDPYTASAELLAALDDLPIPEGVIGADGSAPPDTYALIDWFFKEFDTTSLPVELPPQFSDRDALLEALQISPNGSIGYASIQFDADTAPAIPPETIAAIRSGVAELRSDGVEVELGGLVFADSNPSRSTEIIGLVSAVIILLIAFGSLLAMGLPIGAAMFGIGVGLGVVQLLSHVTVVPEFSIQLATMIGIGVGIDYALFIVTRYRQGLAEGLDPEESTVVAMDTSGRAVIFAGITVVVSLLGMLLIDISFVRGLGVACAGIVLVTLIASVTIMPALLGFVGYNIDKFKIPGLGGKSQDSRETIWFRWSRVLQRRPWPALVIGLILILGLAAPIAAMRLGTADDGTLPTSTSSRRAYDLKIEGFGDGSNGPFLMAVNLPDAGAAASLEPLVQTLTRTPGVASVLPSQVNAEGDAAVFTLIPTTRQSSTDTAELLHRLRNDVIPDFQREHDVEVHIGGMTALFEDMADQTQAGLPTLIIAILGLAFIFLMAVFRSILVPLKAVILNLLSIGAAYGFIVVMFQWGWGKDLIGVGAGGPIESFVPMMLFAILFGLSMDYEVFMLSRIKEEYDRTGDNALAVADGLSATARVITAAAAIMVMVFGSFVLSDARLIKMFGLGLAAAVFFDATIIRLLLVPASMELMGRANWWFPRWLGWLPQIHIEGRRVPSGSSSGPNDEAG